MRIRVTLLLAGLFWLMAILTAPLPAMANSAPPRFAGDKGGVVLPGATNQVHVKQEKLEFDLTTEYSTAMVTAAYQLENRGTDLPAFPVVFVIQDSGRDSLADLKADWNGKALTTTPLDTSKLTPDQHKAMDTAWTAMDTVIDPLTGQRYSTSDFFGHTAVRYVGFSLDLPAGSTGTLTVRYKHTAAMDKTRHLYPIYHYQYLLLPARGWASFGPLEIRVKVPDTTQPFFASTLPMQYQDGYYEATFPGLPAENLAFAVMSRKGLLWGITDVGPYYWLAFLPALAAAILLGWGLGWVAGLIRRKGLAMTTAIGVAVFLVGPFEFLLIMAIMGLIPALDYQNYDNLFYALLQWLVLLPVIATVAGVVTARRHRRRMRLSNPVDPPVSQ